MHKSIFFHFKSLHADENAFIDFKQTNPYNGFKLI